MLSQALATHSSARALALILVTAILFTRDTCAAKKLPSGIVPCNRSDPELNECALKSANNAIPLFTKGIPSLGLAPLDPLQIDLIHIGDSGTSRQFTIDLSLKNLNVTGIRDFKFTDIKVDPESGNMQVKGKAPLLTMLGGYDVKARLLLIPIIASGGVNITLQNVTFTYSWRLQRNGKYATPVDNKVDFSTTKPTIHLDRFINGNKALSDTVGEFFNENWQEVVADLGPPIAEALNVAATRAVLSVFSQVPYKDVFLGHEPKNL